MHTFNGDFIVKYNVIKAKTTSRFRRKIDEGFGRYAIQHVGIDGLSEDPIAFEIRENNTFMGCVAMQMYWGQLHIIYLYVEEGYRDQGLGSTLLNHAITIAKERGCDFLFLETMNFEAPLYYQKFGFEVNFIRHGYTKGTSLYYLSKNISDRH